MTVDPIKVSVNVPGESIDKATAELMSKAFGASADEAGSLAGDLIGIISDNVRGWRHINRIRIAKKIREKIERCDVSLDEVVSIPMREIPAILGGISDVDQPNISDLWAGLIASALNPESEFSTDRSFTSTLNMMNESDALLFSILVNSSTLQKLAESYGRRKSPPQDKSMELLSDELQDTLSRRREVFLSEIYPAVSWVHDQIKLIDRDSTIKRSASNLNRLGLIDYGSSYFRSTLSQSGLMRRFKDERDKITAIDKYINELRNKEKMLERCKSHPVSVEPRLFPGFNIHLTDWGNDFAKACMIEPPPEISSILD